MTEPTLVIFCKWPRLHKGKQRLAKTIGAEKAYQLAKLLFNCALEDALNWEGEVVLTLDEQADIDEVNQLISNKQQAIQAQNLAPKKPSKHIFVLTQPQGNLGQRINHIDQTLRAQGRSQLVFIGTDSPLLNPFYYQQVKTQLKSSNVVLSKADDGGVIIMANNKAWPDLTHLPWSESTLAEKLSHLCIQSNLTLEYIDSGFDVDIEPELSKLLTKLNKDVRPARRALHQWLIHYFNQKQELSDVG